MHPTDQTCLAKPMLHGERHVDPCRIVVGRNRCQSRARSASLIYATLIEHHHLPAQQDSGRVFAAASASVMPSSSRANRRPARATSSADTPSSVKCRSTYAAASSLLMRPKPAAARADPRRVQFQIVRSHMRQLACLIIDVVITQFAQPLLNLCTKSHEIERGHRARPSTVK